MDITARLSGCGGLAKADPAPAATLVIFGAAGDLTKRLLMPSLYNLRLAGLLDDRFSVVGVDHNERDDAKYQETLTEAMQGFVTEKGGEFSPSGLDDGAWGWIRERLHYQTGDFTDDATYQALKGRLQGSCVFYLAVAARFFGPVIEHLAGAGLMEEKDGAFRRVVVEKPFGHDLDSARKLNALILGKVAESQVFRIDHFLGKETVQNIMAFRFGNGVFEPLWNRDHIDHVQITAAETVGVEERGSFYEPTGALRDMVPNHMFQLLASVAMEPPNSFDAGAVRAEKAKVLQAIKPMDPADVPRDAVRGQYGAGAVKGKDVPGYRQEPDVAPDSGTETYIALRLKVDNWRWAGVPRPPGLHPAGQRRGGPRQRCRCRGGVAGRAADPLRPDARRPRRRGVGAGRGRRDGGQRRPVPPRPGCRPGGRPLARCRPAAAGRAAHGRPANSRRLTNALHCPQTVQPSGNRPHDPSCRQPRRPDLCRVPAPRQARGCRVGPIPTALCSDPYGFVPSSRAACGAAIPGRAECCLRPWIAASLRSSQ